MHKVHKLEYEGIKLGFISLKNELYKSKKLNGLIRYMDRDSKINLEENMNNLSCEISLKQDEDMLWFTIEQTKDVDLFILDLDSYNLSSSNLVEALLSRFYHHPIIAINCERLNQCLSNSYKTSSQKEIIDELDICYKLDNLTGDLLSKKVIDIKIEEKLEFFSSKQTTSKYGELYNWIITYSWNNILYGILCEITEVCDPKKLKYLESSNIYINKYVNVKELFMYPDYCDIILNELKIRYHNVIKDREYGKSLKNIARDYSKYVTDNTCNSLLVDCFRDLKNREEKVKTEIIDLLRTKKVIEYMSIIKKPDLLDILTSFIKYQETNPKYTIYNNEVYNILQFEIAVHQYYFDDDRREWDNNLGLIATNYNSIALSAVLELDLNITSDIICSLGPAISIEKLSGKFNKKLDSDYIEVFDFMCLGSEYKIGEMVTEFDDSRIISGIGIGMYKVPYRKYKSGNAYIHPIYNFSSDDDFLNHDKPLNTSFKYKAYIDIINEDSDKTKTEFMYDQSSYRYEKNESLNDVIANTNKIVLSDCANTVCTRCKYLEERYSCENCISIDKDNCYTNSENLRKCESLSCLILASALIKDLDENYKNYINEIFREYVFPQVGKTEDRQKGLEYYTTHSWKHISNLIEITQNLIEYFVNLKLTELEKFILFISILMHDYMMMKSGIEKRKEHATKLKDELLELMKNKNSPFNIIAKELPYGKQTIELIGDICSVHSDQGEKDVTKMYKVKYLDTKVKLGNDIIRVRFLAGILRFVDELDTTQQRMNYDLDILATEAISHVSIGHFKRSQLITSISYNTVYDPRVLGLVINDDAIFKPRDVSGLAVSKSIIREKCIDSTQICSKVVGFEENNDITLYADQHDYQLVCDRRDKIQNELDYFHIHCLSEYKDIVYRHTKVDLISDVEALDEYDKSTLKLQNHIFTPFDLFYNKNSSSDDYSVFNYEDIPYQERSMCLSKSLTTKIIRDELLYPGHYHLDDDLSSNNWINMSEIFSDKDIRNDIVYGIAKQILKVVSDRLENENSGGCNTIIKLLDEIKNYTIVGLGINGIRIGKAVAHVLDTRFMYIVDSMLKSKHPLEELELSQTDGKFVIINDALITGKSLRDSIDTISDQCLKSSNRVIDTSDDFIIEQQSSRISEDEFLQNEREKEITRNKNELDKLEFFKNLIGIVIMFRKSNSSKCLQKLLDNLSPYEKNIYYLNDDIDASICAEKEFNTCHRKPCADSKINCDKCSSFHDPSKIQNVSVNKRYILN